MIKNGVPVCYFEALAFIERIEVGFNVYYTFNRDRFGGDAGLPLVNTDLGVPVAANVPDVPRDRNYRTPQDNAVSYDNNLQFVYARQLTNAIGFRNTLSYRYFNDEYFLVGKNGLIVNVDYTQWGWTQLIFGLVVAFAGSCSKHCDGGEEGQSTKVKHSGASSSRTQASQWRQPRPSMSMSGSRPAIKSLMIFAEPQAMVQPSLPWPILTSSRSTGVRPRIGEPSGVEVHSPTLYCAFPRSAA